MDLFIVVTLAAWSLKAALLSRAKTLARSAHFCLLLEHYLPSGAFKSTSAKHHFQERERKEKGERKGKKEGERKRNRHTQRWVSWFQCSICDTIMLHWTAKFAMVLIWYLKLQIHSLLPGAAWIYWYEYSALTIMGLIFPLQLYHSAYYQHIPNALIWKR